MTILRKADLAHSNIISFEVILFIKKALGDDDTRRHVLYVLPINDTFISKLKSKW